MKTSQKINFCGVFVILAIIYEHRVSLSEFFTAICAILNKRYFKLHNQSSLKEKEFKSKALVNLRVSLKGNQWQYLHPYNL